MPKSSEPYDNCWVMPVDRRKLEASVLVFTVFSTLLIVPPLVYIFNQPIMHAGLPQIVIYLFAVWLVMIAGTALLTRHLPRASDGESGQEEG